MRVWFAESGTKSTSFWKTRRSKTRASSEHAQRLSKQRSQTGLSAVANQPEGIDKSLTVGGSAFRVKNWSNCSAMAGGTTIIGCYPVFCLSYRIGMLSRS